MTTAVRTTKSEPRPLKVLVPLIKEALKDAKEAANEAAMPHWLRAASMMLEAKPQMDHGEFEPWIKRNFDIGVQHARKLMALARKTMTIENARDRAPTTYSDAVRASGGSPRGAEYGGAAWKAPVSETISRINFDRLRQEEQSRADERKLEKELALKLIDIGYKVLATQLHPDKSGGSRDAMARLNHVRDRLKGVYK